MTIKISFIVPMYNVEKYLPQCLDSILKQTISKEIILIDDGSTDNTLNIALRYQRQYSEIQVLAQSNHGQSHARNQGIHLARGEYICFIDADDFLVGNLMPLFARILDNHQDVDLVRYHAVIKEDNDDNDNDPMMKATRFNFLDSPRVAKINSNDKYSCTIRTLAEWFKKMILEDEWVAWVWLYVIRRDFLIKNNIYFNEKITHEDNMFIMQLFSASPESKIMEIDAFPYVYRKNTNSTMGKLKKNPTLYFTQLTNTLTVMSDYWVNQVDFEKMPYYVNQVLKLEIGVLVRLYHNSFNDQEREECKELLAQFARLDQKTGVYYAFVAKYPHANAQTVV